VNVSENLINRFVILTIVWPDVVFTLQHFQERTRVNVNPFFLENFQGVRQKQVGRTRLNCQQLAATAQSNVDIAYGIGRDECQVIFAFVIEDDF
jgi:hypothetical protein